MQGCEMRDPLGPFCGKNFGTFILPWIVTLEALKAFQVPAAPHTKRVADYLQDPDSVIYNLNIEAELTQNGTTSRVCNVGFDHMYWTFRHMLAHHSVGRCPLNTRDLLASEIVSGNEKSQYACLMELTMDGKEPCKLDDGTELRYLEDGDVLRFTAVAGDESAGAGSGECVGTIKSAKT